MNLFLRLLPGREGTCENGLTAARQMKSPLAFVFAVAPRDPAMPVHNCQSATESRAIHGEHLTEVALILFAGQREHLEDGELRAAQAKRPESFFVMLRQSTSRAAKRGAHARERRDWCFAHAR